MSGQQRLRVGRGLDLTARAAAGKLGVAVTTLRSWDRRYGLGASRVSAGGHRRYSPADMDRLEQMCALVAEGVPTAQAARAVLVDVYQGGRPGGDGAPRGRSGGGHTLPTGPDAGHRARGLARATMRLDSTAVREVLDRAIAEMGVAAAWEDLIQPVLYGMGRKWEGGAGETSLSKYVEAEHLLSECVLAALHRATPGLVSEEGSRALAPCAFGTRGVLLSCTATELHTLPLHALNAALAQQFVATRMFGAALPAEALCRAVLRTRPSAVVLWSQHADTADPTALDLLDGSPGTTVLAGGAGWGTRLPPDVIRLSSLAQALATLIPPA